MPGGSSSTDLYTSEGAGRCRKSTGSDYGLARGVLPVGHHHGTNTARRSGTNVASSHAPNMGDSLGRATACSRRRRTVTGLPMNLDGAAFSSRFRSDVTFGAYAVRPDGRAEGFS